MHTFYLLGVPITIASPDDILLHIEHSVKENKGVSILTPNPEIIVSAQRDKQLSRALRRADIAVPDGIGVALALLLRGIRVHRMPGRVLFVYFLDMANRHGWKVFLFGASEESNKRSIDRIRKEYPSIQVKGGTRTEDEKEIVSFQPHLVFVALGCPKQELWIDRMRTRLPHAVMMTVGGALDYFSGVVPSPPQIVSMLGFEWLFRLIIQPWRWKRIINATVVFSWYVIRDMFNRNR